MAPWNAPPSTRYVNPQAQLRRPKNTPFHLAHPHLHITKQAYIDLTAAAQARLASFGPAMVAQARAQSKLAGLEGKEHAQLSRSDVRNGVLLPTTDGGAEDTKPAATTEAESGTHEQCQGNTASGDSPATMPPAGIPAAAAAWWDRSLPEWTTNERLMVCGAVILSEMRAAVTAELGYTCSGGLAPSKLLAKLGSGMHKPNQQTLIVQEMVPLLLGPLPVARLKGLGGDFGKKVMEDLQCTTIGEVVQTPLAQLQSLYGADTADWLFKLVRGVDEDQVEDRRLAKSVSCGKTFYGHNNLRSLEQVLTWLKQLAGELTERLRGDASMNERIPQLLTVSFQAVGLGGTHQNVSRSCPLRMSIEQLLDEEATTAVTEQLADMGLASVRKWHKQHCDETPHLAAAHHALCLGTLYLTAGNFLEIKQKQKMTSFFSKAEPSASASFAAAGGAGAGATASASSPVAAAASPRKDKAAAAASSSAPPVKASLQEFFKKDSNSQSQKRKAVVDIDLTSSAPAPSHPHLDPDAIDPAVLEALPLDIRNEVLAGIEATKRAKTTAAGKIDRFFKKGGEGGGGSTHPHNTHVNSPVRPPPPPKKPKGGGGMDKFLKSKPK